MPSMNEGSSISPLVKRSRQSRHHIRVEIPSQLIMPYTLGWSNWTSLFGDRPICMEEHVDFSVVRPNPNSCLLKWSSSPTLSLDAMWPNRQMPMLHHMTSVHRRW